MPLLPATVEEKNRPLLASVAIRMTLHWESVMYSVAPPSVATRPPPPPPNLNSAFVPKPVLQPTVAPEAPPPTATVVAAVLTFSTRTSPLPVSATKSLPFAAAMEMGEEKVVSAPGPLTAPAPRGRPPPTIVDTSPCNGARVGEAPRVVLGEGVREYVWCAEAESEGSAVGRSAARSSGKSPRSMAPRLFGTADL